MARHLTRHVLERMAQRGITEEDINLALDRPTGRTQPGAPGSIWTFGHATEGRILKVCVAADDKNRVITAAWPDQ